MECHKYGEQVQVGQKDVQKRDCLRKKITKSGAVAHTCNPSYSGGGDGY
jgi:hypothetical protein